MLKLTEVMLHEERPQRRSSDVEQWIRLAVSEHPHITVDDFLCGERDDHGHVRPTGYTGWFWLLGRGSSPACVSRVCSQMQCYPATPVADLLEVTA